LSGTRVPSLDTANSRTTSASSKLKGATCRACAGGLSLAASKRYQRRLEIVRGGTVRCQRPSRRRCRPTDRRQDGAGAGALHDQKRAPRGPPTISRHTTGRSRLKALNRASDLRHVGVVTGARTLRNEDLRPRQITRNRLVFHIVVQRRRRRIWPRGASYARADTGCYPGNFHGNDLVFETCHLHPVRPVISNRKWPPSRCDGCHQPARLPLARN